MFKYREEGNYNDMIMIVLNKLMEVVDETVNSDNEGYDDDSDYN